jgi:hypothetical protein
MKDVRPRIDRAQLAQLGSQFALRAAQQGSEAGSEQLVYVEVGGEAGAASCSPAPAAIAGPSRQAPAAGPSPASGPRGASRRASLAAGSQAATSSADGAASDPAAAGEQLPPWRRKSGRERRQEPEVQIFAPFGGDLSDEDTPPPGQPPQGEAVSRVSSSGGCEAPCRSQGSGSCGSQGMHQVLSQLHDVLSSAGGSADDGNEEGGAGGSADSSASAREGSSSGSSASQAEGAAGRTEGDTRVPATAAGAEASGQLRAQLVQELGEPGLQAACAAMRQLLEAGDGSAAAASSGHEQAQAALAELLVGPSDPLCVLRMLHRLVAEERPHLA